MSNKDKKIQDRSVNLVSRLKQSLVSV